jgi:uncharacterized BrkB/YihY/UPF0761 family membrane protein
VRDSEPAPLLESPPTSGLSAVAPRGSFLGELLTTLDRSNIPLLASALTFDAILALIPFSILLIAGLGLLLTRTEYFGMLDPGALIGNFLPAHQHQAVGDPMALVEGLLVKIRGFRSTFTWVAVPAFLWFSTRMFGAVRVCLSNVFHAQAKAMPGSYVVSYLIGYAVGKGRDLLMVIVVLALALVNTLLSGAISVLTGEGIYLEPPWTFFVSGLGVILGEFVAIASGVALFVALYRYASPRRLSWRGSLIAAAVSTVGFELAKRLFGLYLAHAARGGQFAVDVNIGAATLLILWLWYMALVFLLGASVAHVWEGRR